MLPSSSLKVTVKNKGRVIVKDCSTDIQAVNSTRIVRTKLPPRKTKASPKQPGNEITLVLLARNITTPIHHRMANPRTDTDEVRRILREGLGNPLKQPLHLQQLLKRAIQAAETSLQRLKLIHTRWLSQGEEAKVIPTTPTGAINPRASQWAMVRDRPTEQKMVKTQSKDLPRARVSRLPSDVSLRRETHPTNQLIEAIGLRAAIVAVVSGSIKVETRRRRPRLTTPLS